MTKFLQEKALNFSVSTSLGILLTMGARFVLHINWVDSLLIPAGIYVILAIRMFQMGIRPRIKIVSQVTYGRNSNIETVSNQDRPLTPDWDRLEKSDQDFTERSLKGFLMERSPLEYIIYAVIFTIIAFKIYM